MRIRSTAVEGSSRSGTSRLVAEIEYENAGLADERFWIEAPESVADDLRPAVDPWLAILAPLAVALKEPLRADHADPELIEGIESLMQVWTGWYPDVEPVAVSALPCPARSPETPLTGAFFSGGVDSFFTVLSRNEPELAHLLPIDELLLVHGLDIPLENRPGFERHRLRMEDAASGMGKPLVSLATNVRETTWKRADWERMAHGCLLAGIGLALGGRYGRVLIPSSISYRRPLRSWGSHPLTDPLLSTSATRIQDDGARYRRIDKTGVVGRSETAQAHLHVCWRGGSDDNCGRCAKCLRTLAMLELHGTREAVRSFPDGSFTLEALRRMHLALPSDFRVMTRLAADARRMGRDDVADAIEASLRRTRWSRPILEQARRLARVPLLGRLGWQLERALLADRIV